MESYECYIDGRICSGARFSFCTDCQTAKEENREQLLKATTPIEVTMAHIPAHLQRQRTAKAKN